MSTELGIDLALKHLENGSRVLGYRERKAYIASVTRKRSTPGQVEDDEFTLRILSLGAGVQSTVMYRMAARGEFEHTPSHAIFADTQAEPNHVYAQLDQLDRDHGDVIPILRVTAGSLEKNLYVGGEGREGFAQIPAYLIGQDMSEGMGRRQCSFQYKIKPIERAVRDLLGLKKGERAQGRYRVQQWIGISVDEAHRAKSDNRWLQRYYPLLFEKPMRRGDCIQWSEKHGYPIPRSSSCYFCPYHSDKEWVAIKRDYPDLWERAVTLDHDLRGGKMRAGKDLRGSQYLHPQRVPLDEVKLRGDHDDQPDLFGNECEGVCGV